MDTTSYLENEVLTATPEKLQMMLIDGALRAIEHTRQCWRGGDVGGGGEWLLRAEDIMGGLLAGLNREANPSLAAKMSAIYLFVLRSLVEAGGGRDETRLDDAVRVLGIERETWRMVCERLTPDTTAPAEPGTPPAPATALPPALADELPAGGLSLEA